MKGPSLRVNERLFGASLLDICPTILTLFGLAPAKDMDGKVLLTAFKEPPPVEPIESWDKVPGDAGTHPPETQLDPVASAEAFKQLVDLGYVAPPGPNEKENIDECVRELKYNLARAYRDGNCCGEAAALAEELWTRWPKEHRFGILLVGCLAPLRQLERRRAVIEELGRRIEKYQAEAKAELAKRKEQKDSEEKEEQDTPAKRRAQFEERQLRELAHGRPLLIEWLLASQFLLEKRPAEARPFLEMVAAAACNADIPVGARPVGEPGLNSNTRAKNANKYVGVTDELRQRVASALVELGEMDEARQLLETALDNDPENALVHAQLAGIHFRARRFDQAIAAAVESLSLLYFQPGLHALLGQALLETKRIDDAERELLVAVSQSPRHIAAHHLLAKLYREHLNRPADAFAHEGRARSLRNEVAAVKRERAETVRIAADGSKDLSPSPWDEDRGERDRRVHQSTVSTNLFGPEVDPTQIITIVSGLPRSGTSLMMQLLVAAGREALTDSKRAADEDNPLGYFEFEKAIELAKDTSWLQQARGKVVKIVAQLLPHLPSNEHYHIIFMERDLTEVIASQKAMLARQSRRGAELDEHKLRDTYTSQLNRVHTQLARRPEVRMLTVNYSDLVTDPTTQVSTLAEFLRAPFDSQAAANAVRPDLHRQKFAAGPV